MFPERLYPYFTRRLWLLGFVATGLMLFLVWRLWQIQGRHEEQFSQRVVRQSIRRIRLEAVRGRILAADNTVLVDNRPSYNLIFHCAEMRQPGRHARTVDYILSQGWRLAYSLGRAAPLTASQLQRHLRLYPALPLTVFTDLTAGEVARLEEMAPPVPGTEIVPDIVRCYPFPGMSTHLLGFTGKRQPEPEDATQTTSSLAYVLPEYAGREGLERFYDKELAGHSGEKMVMVDILGYVHEAVGISRPAVPGNDLILTVDARAQRSADAAMAGYSGALVVVDVTSGGILAMASSPTYDLSALTSPLYQALARDELRKPLLNRAVAGSYLPGSIIKPLTALAALQSGAINAATTVNCPGYITLGTRPIRCWKRDGHGPTVDLTMALAQSCNTYFIHAGLTAGFDALLPMLDAAGFGDVPELDLPGAAGGFLPSHEWARRHWSHDWQAADTAFLSIGQGPVNVTPLQVAMFTAAIANGGTLYRPFLVQAIRDQDENLRQITAPRPLQHLPVSAENLELVRHGMWECVNAEHGTAASARTPRVSLAGKTGTAEVDTGDSREKNTWFIGYGPVENPQFAIAIVVERGESGGHTASPLARRFLEGWLAPEQTAAKTP